MKIVRAIAALCAVSALAMSSMAHEARHAKEEKEMEGSPVTVQGEILDMHCYMGHGAKGPKHKECARKCLNEGAPAGLLGNDGKVYLLVEDHDKSKPYQELRKKGAEEVTVKGKLFNRGGVQAIVVE